MKTRFFYILIICLMASNVYSQTNLNNYKYIIVAEKFDFLKEANEFRLNELAQFLFNKYGFEAIIEGEEYPEDLLKNRCLGLKSDVFKDSGMFKSKLTVQLKNCNDRIVFTSEVGESREKQFDKAYTEALRNAFVSIEALNYKYEPSKNILGLETPAVKNEVATEIQQLKQEIESLKKSKEVAVVTETKPKEEAVKTTPVELKKVQQINEPTKALISEGVLYAQAIDNGYQLVDSTPKVLYKIKKTGIANVFMVENKSGTLYQKDGKWILEYYENNILKQEILNIKF